MALLQGTLVAEKYEIIARIGEGGMGEVFRARQVALDRDVALKLLKEIGPAGSETFKRFLREAKILGSLMHRNLVACFEFGEWRGTAFIAMEYVDGHSLMKELAAHKGLDAARVLKIAQQIAPALACAHAAGVTHRDLKPQNILLCEDDTGASDLVKLIDFGLARLIPTDGKSVTKLTQTGLTVGSIAYMAPEQCLGLPADARADIYAFGAAMHHALRGFPPFDAENPMIVMQKHLEEPPPPIGRDDLPRGLEAVLQRCMAKDAGERYQSATQLAEALDVVARGEGEEFSGFVPRVTSLQTVKAEPEQVPVGRIAASALGVILAGSVIIMALAKGMEVMLKPRPAQDDSAYSTADSRYRQMKEPWDNSPIGKLHNEHIDHVLRGKPVNAKADELSTRMYLAQNPTTENGTIALSQLAKLYGDAGDLKRAGEIAEEAREYGAADHDISLPDPYWASAQVFMRSGDFRFASRAVNEALHRVEPSGRTHFQFAREWLEGQELVTIAQNEFGVNSAQSEFANTVRTQHFNRIERDGRTTPPSSRSEE